MSDSGGEIERKEKEREALFRHLVSILKKRNGFFALGNVIIILFFKFNYLSLFIYNFI